MKKFKLKVPKYTFDHKKYYVIKNVLENCEIVED